MSETYETFVTSIEQTLTKNGYPEKRVALPLEKMYEVAYEKGLNFNKALEMLAAKGIGHEKTTEKVIFSWSAAAVDAAMQPDAEVNPADMMAKAAEMLKNMPPDQLQKLQDMYQNMSDEQRADVMRKAKDMGLF